MDWGKTSPIPKEVYEQPMAKLNEMLGKIWDVDLIDGPKKITFRDLYDNFLGLECLSEPTQKNNIISFTLSYNGNLRDMTSGKKLKDASFEGDNRNWNTDKISESDEPKKIIETLSKKQHDKLLKETDDAEMRDGWNEQKTDDGVVFWREAMDSSGKKDSSEKKDSPDVLLLGVYLPHLRKIVLYRKNIEIKAKKITKKNENWEVAFAYCYITTLVHELHHALFHYITECKLQRKFRYNYIREVEEAITEMSTLMFIEKLVKKKLPFKGCLEYANDRIKGKQKSGTLAAYGFGYYLFHKEEKNLLFKNYIKKLGDLDLKDSEVEQYTLDVCPFYPDGEAIVAKRLNDILL